MMLGVVGSRDYPDLDKVRKYLSERRELPIEGVVSGGARGVDRAAEQWALDNGLRVVSFRPFNLGDGTDTPWAVDRRVSPNRETTTSTVLPERYRGFAAAAFVRNGYIVEWSEYVVAFWNGKSTGTQHTVNRARADGKLLAVVR